MTATIPDAGLQAVLVTVRKLAEETITVADAADTIRALGLSPDPTDLLAAKQALQWRDHHIAESAKRADLAAHHDLQLRLAVDRLARPAEGQS